MRKILLLIAVLMPAPGFAAELWCMPDTLCNPQGACKTATDEESSVRLDNLKSKATSMRAHAETIAMDRTKAGAAQEWRGTNQDGEVEYVIWSATTNDFTYTVTTPDGSVWRSTGKCEVQ